MDPLNRLDPLPLERLVSARHPQTDENRSILGEEDKVPNRSGSARRWKILRERAGEGEYQESDGGRHPRIALIGVDLGSTIRIGRPLSTTFCLDGSMPRVLTTVASRSGTVTGWSLIFSPSAPVSPMA